MCGKSQRSNSSSMTSATRHGPHRLLLDSESSTRSSYPKGNEGNFDTNMVIILAALLCALICALGLNSIVRCAIRCSRRFALEREDGRANSGLKKRALREIPVWVYGSGAIDSLPCSECPICLGEYMEGEKVRVLPKCKHGFHVRCIDTWLLSHSSCPTCRQSLVEAAAASDAIVDVNNGNSAGGGASDEAMG